MCFISTDVLVIDLLTFEDKFLVTSRSLRCSEKKDHVIDLAS